jgi:glucosylglycerate synthase
MWHGTESTSGSRPLRFCDGFRVCQSYLGTKLHDAKDPGADLSAMLVQVLGTLFALMDTYATRWRGVMGSTETPLMGFRFAVGVEPIAVDVSRMIARFRSGALNLADIWAEALEPDNLEAIRSLAMHDGAGFCLDDRLWTRVVYDLAAAYHHRPLGREQLLKASLPLYLGRVASFILEISALDADAVETRLERLCLEFEAAKPYLAARWQSPTPAGGHRTPGRGPSSKG